MSFARQEDFDRLLRVVELRKLPVLSGPPARFEGTAEEHRTLFLTDPAGNVLEFKCCAGPRLMY